MPHADLSSIFANLKFDCKYSRKYVLTYRTALQIHLLFLEETMPNSALEKLQGKQSLILISAELGPESKKWIYTYRLTKARCQDNSPHIKSKLKKVCFEKTSGKYIQERYRIGVDEI